MTSISGKYYREIDILKGIAILLVIWGHCFCSHPINIGSQLPLLGDVVRSFQMPLFFVASGFLFSTKGGFSKFIHKKATRLVVPYLSFGILSVCLRFIFSSITNGGDITWGGGVTKVAERRILLVSIFAITDYDYCTIGS